jgi:predicted DNA-binding helix-hairpin-helix protein
LLIHPSGPARGGPLDARLPGTPGLPPVREHRLYQADWLLRFYHFAAGEIPGENGTFP